MSAPSPVVGTRPVIALRFDLRRPEFAVSHRDLFAAMLELAAYADQNGLDRVHVSEHHHAEDGHLSSVFPALAAIAARTERVRIRPSVLVLPLHDPVRVAEDAVAVDNISGGRLDVAVAAGYREVEFQSLGASFSDRGTRLRRAVQFLRRAWTGEPTEYEGRPVLVRPLPVQPGGPPIIMGGSTPKTARRAAEIADGYDPADPALIDDYLAACAELGKQPGEHDRRLRGAFFIHFADDPEKARRLLAPHVQHEMQAYARWEANSSLIGQNAPDIPVERVWDVGTHQVMTPDEAIAYFTAQPEGSLVTLHPLCGGLPPALAAESLQLFVEKVLPALGPARATPDSRRTSPRHP